MLGKLDGGGEGKLGAQGRGRKHNETEQKEVSPLHDVIDHTSCTSYNRATSWRSEQTIEQNSRAVQEVVTKAPQSNSGRRELTSP